MHIAGRAHSLTLRVLSRKGIGCGRLLLGQHFRMADQATKTFSSVLTEIDTAQYEPQLDAKAERIRAQFAQFAPPELEVFRSQPVNHRMR